MYLVFNLVICQAQAAKASIFTAAAPHSLSSQGAKKKCVMKSPAGSFSTEGHGEKSVNANEWFDYRSCLGRHYSPNYTAQKEKS